MTAFVTGQRRALARDRSRAEPRAGRLRPSMASTARTHPLRRRDLGRHYNGRAAEALSLTRELPGVEHTAIASGAFCVHGTVFYHRCLPNDCLVGRLFLRGGRACSDPAVSVEWFSAALPPPTIRLPALLPAERRARLPGWRPGETGPLSRSSSAALSSPLPSQPVADGSGDVGLQAGSKARTGAAPHPRAATRRPVPAEHGEHGEEPPIEPA